MRRFRLFSGRASGGNGHPLHSHAARIHVSDGGDGLAQMIVMALPLDLNLTGTMQLPQGVAATPRRRT
jgi:hypothetical protein